MNPNSNKFQPTQTNKPGAELTGRALQYKGTMKNTKKSSASSGRVIHTVRNQWRRKVRYKKLCP
jgi:hypothetical protein